MGLPANKRRRFGHGAAGITRSLRIMLSPEEQDRSDMARLAAGHDAALNDLMHRYAEPLFRYLARTLQDEDEAADLAQESFVRVYQHRARFKNASKFSTWLYAIATNLARDRFRRLTRHPSVSLDAENPVTGHTLADQITTTRLAPDDSLVANERAAAVREALAELPEDLRTPLVLAEYEDHTLAEIAQILACSPKAAEMRIYRARQQLRARLTKMLEAT